MILAVVQSTLVLFVALIASVILRRRSAAVRHLILAAGLVGALLAPALSLVLPSWRVPRKFQVRPVNSLFSKVTVVGNEGIHRSDLEFPAVSEAPLGNVTTARDIVIRVWMFGSAIGAVFLLAGIGRIALIALRARPIRPISNLKRPVLLLQTDASLLGTFGVFRPRIFLPEDYDTWSDDRLRAVLTHELAHIRRFDWPVQMLAEIARTIYWFNPLFWIACRRLRMESEHACDDSVLNAGIDAKDYAAHLLELARTLKNPGRRWSPVLAMAQPPHLERRFIAMLNPSLNRQSVTRPAVVVVAVVALALTLPLAAMRAPEPELQNPAPANIVVVEKAPAAIAAKPEAAARPPVPAAQPVQRPADGSLSGYVYDASGARVPGVTLTLSILVTQPGSVIEEVPVQTVVSGETGGFLFPALAPGRYSLQAQLPGFARYRKSSVEIKPGQNLRDNVVMTVGNMAQAVEVSSAGGRPPNAPIPVETLRRIRVGGNVAAATLLTQVKPIYPASARDAGIEGLVHLQGVIGTNGALTAVRVVSTNDPALGSAALESVKQWLYKPAMLNGEPIEVVTDIDVYFSLVQ